MIKGHNAYGYLKAEKGVHRLVRISPFDSSGRRHTSFASCDVIPDFNNDEIEIEINPDDITVDTFRASGAGGQHINKTESAIRITHHPTGIVVNNQNERSQIKNREAAMKMLKSKLYQLKLDEQEREMAEIRGEQKKLGGEVKYDLMFSILIQWLKTIVQMKKLVRLMQSWMAILGHL